MKELTLFEYRDYFIQQMKSKNGPFLSQKSSYRDLCALQVILNPTCEQYVEELSVYVCKNFPYLVVDLPYCQDKALAHALSLNLESSNTPGPKEVVKRNLSFIKQFIASLDICTKSFNNDNFEMIRNCAPELLSEHLMKIYEPLLVSSLISKETDLEEYPSTLHFDRSYSATQCSTYNPKYVWTENFISILLEKLTDPALFLWKHALIRLESKNSGYWHRPLLTIIPWSESKELHQNFLSLIDKKEISNFKSISGMMGQKGSTTISNLGEYLNLFANPKLGVDLFAFGFVEYGPNTDWGSRKNHTRFFSPFIYKIAYEYFPTVYKGERMEKCYKSCLAFIEDAKKRSESN